MMLDEKGKGIGTGVAVLAGNRVLLGERTDGQGWALAGGKVEPGESVEAAARRELKEEFNLVAGRLHYVATIDTHALVHGVDTEVVSTVYVTGDYTGYPVPAPGEMRRLEWVPLDKLNDRDLFIPTKSALEEYIKPYLERRLPPRRKYTKDDAQECPRYSDGHIHEGCIFSPEARKSRDESMAVVLCAACVLVERGK